MPTRRTFAFTACALLVASTAFAGKRSAPGPIKRLSLDENAEAVALFEALASGRVTAKVIALDDSEANVFLTNPGTDPITVGLPKTVAAAHVLAQPGINPFGLGNQGIGNGLGLGNGLGNGFQAGGNQTVGGQFQPVNGGFPQGIGNGNPFGQNVGNNFFSIPSERVVQLKLQTVCLDHGKPNPRPQNTYVLQPIERAVESNALRELLAEYDPDRDDRHALQAAAWHLANGKTWQDLDRMTVRRGNRDHRRFARTTLARAWDLVDTARKTAAKTKPPANVDDTASVVRSTPPR